MPGLWQRLGLFSVALLWCAPAWAADDKPISGDAVIRGKAGPSEIVITTTTRLAGAIHSLTWDGQEFINSTDHGRQLQTAWNGNLGIDPIAGETFNPTEAGSRDDGTGPTSTSKLLTLQAAGNMLTTRSYPAFWLQPGETSGGRPARNKTLLSDHLLARRVVIGYKNLPHAIDCQVTITLPPAEHHTLCVFEALTGYMPPEFARFWVLDEQTGRLTALGDGPGEQPRPIVFSTLDGRHAMGAWSPGAPNIASQTGPSYGRWRFKADKVVKWNCVYRVHNAQGLGGAYPYRVFVAVGTLEDVRTTLAGLAADFHQTVPPPATAPQR